MRPPTIFAVIAFVSSSLSFLSSAEPNQGALDAAQLQRRMQEEQITLERKQTTSPQAPTIAPKQLDERRKLNADQRRAREQLQQRQLLLNSATKNTPPNASSPAHTNQTPLQNQLFERERQQQDLSFDIQRQQLQFRQRSGQ